MGKSDLLKSPHIGVLLFLQPGQHGPEAAGAISMDCQRVETEWFDQVVSMNKRMTPPKKPTVYRDDFQVVFQRINE